VVGMGGVTSIRSGVVISGEGVVVLDSTHCPLNFLLLSPLMEFYKSNNNFT